MRPGTAQDRVPGDRETPLFPLNAVLFPGEKLSLRIFEPRYLKLISSCLKKESGFGVVFIRSGNEAGIAASFHETGTLATIIDFQQLDDGLLGVTCKGGNRFQVNSHRIMPDQLVLGRLSYLSQDLPEHQEGLRACLESIKRLLRPILDRSDSESLRRVFTEDWEDADRITFRIADLLPMSMENRQLFLEMDLQERLVQLHQTLSGAC